jgi:ATP-dependent RNA helicase DDX24/MAK5
MGGKSRTTTKKQPVWRKVEDVGLDKYNDVTDKNHYDDDDNGNHLSVADDLEADPRETVGIFMGLEVLEDASAYIITRGGPSNAATTTAAAAESTDPPTEHTKKSKKKKKKTKKVQDETNNTDEEPSKKRQRIEQPANDEAKEKLSRKQKKKSKTKTDTLEVSLHAKNEIANANTDVKDETALQPNEVALQQWQLQWLLATSGVELHMTLVESLHRAGFEQPTPIQAATLAASVLGRRNIVGAASTGSGKTLAFLLPIYQHLLQQQQQLEQDAVQTTTTTRTPLQALILTPTRELALQIHHEGQKLCPANSNNMRIGCLTGGLAVAKQTRVLQQQPPILVATPGRLWELVRYYTSSLAPCLLACNCKHNTQNV